MRTEAIRETGATDRSDFRGWIFYDGQCGFCSSLAHRFERVFERRGLHFTSFQASPDPQRMDLDPGTRPPEMRVQTVDNRSLGGADAVVFLSRQVWWGTPLALVARLPGA